MIPIAYTPASPSGMPGDQAELAQSDAIAFYGPGVESLRNYFEGDDDDVPVTCALLKTTESTTHTLKIAPGNNGVRLRRVLDQSVSPQRVLVQVDGESAGTWYDADRNPWKRLAESDFELPPALVRGKSSLRITFIPQAGPWTMGELRSFVHHGRAPSVAEPR